MRDTIFQILESAGQLDAPIRPTLVFNEGWMLRLLLQHLHVADAGAEHPFRFAKNAKWYSEALLPSAFLPRRRGDDLGEKWTSADGVVGHIRIGNKGKADLSLAESAHQFLVIEAKMFGGLSAGVRRCSIYDQAARYVACMAEVLSRTQTVPAQIDTLAFYVVAPQVQIVKGVFEERVNKPSIRQVVANRVARYDGAKDQWFRDWFEPTLAKIHVGLFSWEKVLENQPERLREFYGKCLDFNGPSKMTPVNR